MRAGGMNVAAGSELGDAELARVSLQRIATNPGSDAFVYGWDFIAFAAAVASPAAIPLALALLRRTLR
jgi:hypothetical protein